MDFWSILEPFWVRKSMKKGDNEGKMEGWMDGKDFERIFEDFGLTEQEY